MVFYIWHKLLHYIRCYVLFFKNVIHEQYIRIRLLGSNENINLIIIFIGIGKRSFDCEVEDVSINCESILKEFFDQHIRKKVVLARTLQTFQTVDRLKIFFLQVLLQLMTCLEVLDFLRRLLLLFLKLFKIFLRNVEIFWNIFMLWKIERSRYAQIEPKQVLVFLCFFANNLPSWNLNALLLDVLLLNWWSTLTNIAF